MGILNFFFIVVVYIKFSYICVYDKTKKINTV